MPVQWTWAYTDSASGWPLFLDLLPWNSQIPHPAFYSPAFYTGLPAVSACGYIRHI
ncbi:hypothetical protein D3C81_2228380 [compost metagenome]